VVTYRSRTGQDQVQFKVKARLKSCQDEVNVKVRSKSNQGQLKVRSMSVQSKGQFKVISTSGRRLFFAANAMSGRIKFAEYYKLPSNSL